MFSLSSLGGLFTRSLAFRARNKSVHSLKFPKVSESFVWEKCSKNARHLLRPAREKVVIGGDVTVVDTLTLFLTPPPTVLARTRHFKKNCQGNDDDFAWRTLFFSLQQDETRLGRSWHYIYRYFVHVHYAPFYLGLQTAGQQPLLSSEPGTLHQMRQSFFGSLPNLTLPSHRWHSFLKRYSTE